MSFLLDTDTCSAHIKGDVQVGRQVLTHSRLLHVSTVTVGELLTWGHRATAPIGKLPAIEALLRKLVILTVDEQVAHRFGVVRDHLLDQGRPTPPSDLFIACTLWCTI